MFPIKSSTKPKFKQKLFIGEWRRKRAEKNIHKWCDCQSHTNFKHFNAKISKLFHEPTTTTITTKRQIKKSTNAKKVERKTRANIASFPFAFHSLFFLSFFSWFRLFLLSIRLISHRWPTQNSIVLSIEFHRSALFWNSFAFACLKCSQNVRWMKTRQFNRSIWSKSCFIWWSCVSTVSVSVSLCRKSTVKNDRPSRWNWDCVFWFEYFEWSNGEWRTLTTDESNHFNWFGRIEKFHLCISHARISFWEFRETENAFVQLNCIIASAPTHNWHNQFVCVTPFTNVLIFILVRSLARFSFARVHSISLTSHEP